MVESCGWACGSEDLVYHMIEPFVSHVNNHQNASTMEDALKNQVDEMTWPVDLNQRS